MAHEYRVHYGTSLSAEDGDLLVLAVRFSAPVERIAQLVQNGQLVVFTQVVDDSILQRVSLTPAFVLRRGSVLDLRLSSGDINWCCWDVMRASELQRNVGLPADGIVGAQTQSFVERLYPSEQPAVQAVESMFEDWSSVTSLAAEAGRAAQVEAEATLVEAEAARIDAEIAWLKRNGPPRPAPKPEIRPTRKIRLPKEPR